MKTIYFAGGCFWGMEKYLSLIPGVAATAVGYANGRTEDPSYEEVCYNDTGHAETVKTEYDPAITSLTFLLELFYDVIDPTSLNCQGGDIGTQYRTGVYYVDEADRDIILGSIALLQESFDKPVVIEVASLKNFYSAEEYHQKYLDKMPGGYCHIGATQFAKARGAVDEATRYRSKSKDELRHTLSELQFEVTQNGATEPPYHNAYCNLFQAGIYVDVTTGEPLFVSTDKFMSVSPTPTTDSFTSLDTHRAARLSPVEIMLSQADQSR